MSFKQVQLKSDTLSKTMRELLGEHLLNTDLSSLEIGSNLSEIQSIAFQKFKNKESVLVLAPAGYGKSFLLKIMQEYNEENGNQKMYITSTTGVSAYNINGMTIHSFMGIGTGDKNIEFLIRRVFKNREIIDRLRNTDILVIDELSMLSASLFEKINLICQHFRKDKTFMGGIQVVFTSDPMQLLPVFNQNPKLFTEPEDTRLIIESKEFNDKFNKRNNNIIVLDKNFRQLGNNKFISLLLRIRLGIHTIDDIKLLKNKTSSFNEESKNLISKNITPVHLVATNRKANVINETNLEKLEGESYKYIVDFNKSGDNKECLDIIKNELESQFKQKNLMELILKCGARVMLIKNLDLSNGLVNGSMGTISSLTNNSVNVLFDNGFQKIITRVDWDIEMNNNTIIARQIPLILCYSITIHKSQGLTLDYSIMDLDNVFAEHQMYVALSRVRSLDGLLLKSFNPSKILVNEKMKSFFLNL